MSNLTHFEKCQQRIALTKLAEDTENHSSRYILEECLNLGLDGPMPTLVNLTQHELTNSQRDSFPGLILDLGQMTTSNLSDALTFKTPPTLEEIEERAQNLAVRALLSGASHALIGGAPYLMGALEIELKKAGVIPIYSFSERKSVEQTSPEGVVTKTNVFEHVAWVGDDGLNPPSPLTETQPREYPPVYSE